uniref:Uncharacterized protein n=2 Tax=Oryza TaxID=4527 RepID=A0A0D3G007_9ORYZ
MALLLAMAGPWMHGEEAGHVVASISEFLQMATCVSSGHAFRIGMGGRSRSILGWLFS